MSRSEASDEKLRKLGAEPIRGELGSPMADALHGVDWVIHCAAKVEDFGHYDDFYRINVTGTNSLLTDCVQARVPRFLFLSTEAVLLDGRSKYEMNEQTPYPLQTPFLYSQTKIAAEKLVRAANSEELQTFVVRPRMVWGPGDTHFIPELKKMAKKKALMWIDQGVHRTSTTHIRNLLHGIDLIMAKGQPGEVYFITDGDPISLREFISMLVETLGFPAPTKSIPGFVARGLAQVLEPLWVLLRLPGKPPMTKLAACFLSTEGTVDITKAKTKLGYRPVISRAAALVELANTETTEGH